jgi:(5-formylfuran-3-yl)methyl phosphate synthase
MRLLVSVTSTFDAEAALAGGADLIDAKDPTAGALGPVSIDQFHRIVGAVAGARPVTAALGDASQEAVIERSAGAFAAAGAAFVKIGFAGIDSADRVASLIAAATWGVEHARDAGARVVCVAYADADGARTMSLDSLVEIAARAGAAGVLLDTFDKRSGGLRDLIAPRALSACVSTVHDAGLFVALAGRLTASDLPFVRDAGADIVGVRGAACEGGRTGHVTADRVRLLRSACDFTPAGVR